MKRKIAFGIVLDRNEVDMQLHELAMYGESNVRKGEYAKIHLNDYVSIDHYGDSIGLYFDWDTLLKENRRCIREHVAEENLLGCATP